MTMIRLVGPEEAPAVLTIVRAAFATRSRSTSR